MACQPRYATGPTSTTTACSALRPTPATTRSPRVFRALAKQLHPDRVGSRSTEQQQHFKQITAAYEVLSNPRMRHDYDSVRAQDAAPELRPQPAPMGRVPGLRRRR